MSLVTPLPQNTALSLYGNIGWDNSNTNIRLFDNPNQRGEYLAKHLVSIADKLSVIKPGERLRVVGKLNDFHQISYMSFTNYGLTNYANNRTYYAFVTSVDYVNVNAVELTYEIDWIQTFLFDIIFKSCRILREHVSNDAVGLWRDEENISYGGYIIRQQTDVLNNPGFILQIVKTDKSAIVAKIDNLVTGCDAWSYTLSGVGMVNDILALFENYTGIVSFNMCTDNMVSYNGGPPTKFTEGWRVDRVLGFANSIGTSDGTYYPRNNKLYCYPFCLLEISNYQDNSVRLMWENFDNPNEAHFEQKGNPLPKPCLVFEPKNYMGFNNQSNFSIQFNNFPLVCFNNDTFKSWFAVYQEQKIIDVASTIVSGVAATAMGIPAPAVAATAAPNLVGGLAGAMGVSPEVKQHRINSGGVNGTPSNGGWAYNFNRIGFRVTGLSIRKEDAQRIDKLFDRYGYRFDNLVKKPNVKGRKYVNYVQCQDAIVGGSIPNDAKVAMEAALNRGVSFWHTDDIGMELPDNPIL